MLDLIGWTGSILLAFCGLPQAWDAIKTGQAGGLTWGFLLAWFVGEVCTLLYILPELNLPLLVNYSANLVFLTVIIFFKLWPRK